MKVDLNYLLEKKPDFYELTRSSQLKYIAFVYTKNAQINFFHQTDIRSILEEFNLVIPSNFGREFNKLLSGKVPVLVKKGRGYSFHPKHEQELTLELFSADNIGLPESTQASKKANTEIFNRYDLHAAIKTVAFSQFQDGYYKEAVQNALVEVITRVKEKAGNPKVRRNGRDIELDGDDLMNRVFGCDNGQHPMIAFNGLSSSLDRAEQRGLMYLFKGIVGIRDKKAHLNFMQNDPFKTLEYLSLASLLLRLIDESS